MSSYNWITFHQNCLSCGMFGRIVAQAHVAASFSGDESGRFNSRIYGLGEKMAWWPTENKKFEKWKEKAELIGKRLSEACYASCETRGCELFAIIEFEDVAPKSIIGLGKAGDWPKGYLR